MEVLTFTGKIITELPMVTGKSEKGPWATQDFVAENTEGRYPQRLLFTIFGEQKINELNIQKGDEVTVSFEPNAKEVKGKWYGTNRAFKVVKK